MKNKILKISFIVLLINTVAICYAQKMPDTYSEYTSGKLEYGLFIPENYDPSKLYPLVMFLHGMGNNHTVYLTYCTKCRINLLQEYLFVEAVLPIGPIIYHRHLYGCFMAVPMK